MVNRHNDVVGERLGSWIEPEHLIFIRLWDNSQAEHHGHDPKFVAVVTLRLIEVCG
jgi:hypothetical protein